MFRNQINRHAVSISSTQNIKNFQSSLVLTTLKLGVDNDEKAICTIAKNLYERARNEKKGLSWEQVFDYLIQSFKTEQNNPEAREALIRDAKNYCPTYERAIEVLNEQQQ
jgi:hypothetical protein